MAAKRRQALIVIVFVGGLSLGACIGVVIAGIMADVTRQARCAECARELKSKHNVDILAGRLWL
jgi:predicted acylesterase/phospholipase RssA